MSIQISISDLLDPEKFKKYEPALMGYFEKGGTWKDLLGLDQNTMNHHYQRAYDFYQTADFKKAGDAFSYLTFLNPYEFNYWMGLGTTKQAGRSFEEAISAYLIAEAISPDNPAPNLHLAQSYYGVNLPELTKEQLQKAIAKGGQPQYAEIKREAQRLLASLRA